AHVCSSAVKADGPVRVHTRVVRDGDGAPACIRPVPGADAAALPGPPDGEGLTTAEDELDRAAATRRRALPACFRPRVRADRCPGIDERRASVAPDDNAAASH